MASWRWLDQTGQGKTLLRNLTSLILSTVCCRYNKKLGAPLEHLKFWDLWHSVKRIHPWTTGSANLWSYGEVVTVIVIKCIQEKTVTNKGATGSCVTSGCAASSLRRFPFHTNLWSAWNNIIQHIIHQSQKQKHTAAPFLSQLMIK